MENEQNEAVETPPAAEPPEMSKAKEVEATLKGDANDCGLSANPKEAGDKNDIDKNSPDVETQNAGPVKDWNMREASVVHGMTETAMEDVVEDTDRGVDVHNEVVSPRVSDNGEFVQSGRIDTVVETPDRTDIIDYKTDQMHNWSPEVAAQKGDEYGQQVKEYVNGYTSDKPVEGNLVMMGSPPSNPESAAAFDKAAGQHDVNVIYSKTGDPYETAHQLNEERGYNKY